MKRRLANCLALAALCGGLASVSAEERALWTDGHGDLRVAYAEGTWNWNVWLDSQPSEVTIGLGEESEALIPDNPNFDFLGEPGNALWIAPQVDREGVVFLGINTSGTPLGTFEGNRFDIRLMSVTGPGDFIMWITGGAGTVEVPMNSRDGIDETDFVDSAAPGHFHQNWGFTSPGTYDVGFAVEGTLTGQSAPILSDEELYRFAVNVYDRGELDMEVAYEGGEWELVLLDEVNEKEIEAGDAALHAGPATWQTVPSDPAFSFLGEPGAGIFILPQDEQEGILFLGIAGDEIEAGAFENDEVSLNLSSVDGPGAVFLYSTDAFGAPTKYFDSADGIGADDQFPLNVGGHSHQNWAFSAPGIYRVGLNASGTLADGTASASADTEFLFEVFGPTIFGEGELDLEVAYEDGEWELVGLDEANEREICANELVIQGSSATETVVPDDPAFAFLGAPGTRVNVLPQEESEGVIFLGIAGDEIEAGVFEGDAVELKLVSSDGPGNVSLYAVDEFGAPSVFFNSGDGITDSDAFPVSVGGHSHQAWGFTQPGVYRVGLQASGQLVGDTDASESEVVVFTFDIQGSNEPAVVTPEAFASGEIDLEVAYEDGEFELVLLDEVNEREIEAGDGVLTAVPSTLEPVPNDPAFGFLGSPGDRVFILPQDEQEGVLFLGIAGDEIPAGEFENDSVALSLVGVSGPGNVFLYATDEFGSPSTFYNSADGIGEDDVFPVNVGGHSHQNWGFSAAGQYEVTLQAAGTKAGSGEAAASEPVAFSFNIIEPEIFNQGELDMEVAYEDGVWELVLLDEVNEREVEPSESLLQGVPATRQTVPDDAAFGFLGSAGDAVWVLPQEETEGVLFLGIAGDEIPAGVFANDAVSLNLIGSRGPGDVSLYAVDEFGVPNVFFNSGDGIDTSDVFPVSVGGHSHQNWGFTAPGVYKLALQASGELQEGAVASASEVVEFTVEILDDSTAQEVFASGEIDLEVAYEDGEFELVLLDEVNEREIEAGDGVLTAVPSTLEPVPNDPAFGFLGSPGDRVFILPQDEQEGVLFLGIAGDEIPAGEFENDSVALSLVGVSGPGNVFLYATDEFGSPTTFYNSADGIGEDDVFPVNVGGHSHQNWGFSAAGQYEVTLQAAGTKAGSGEAAASEPVAFSFNIIEPEIFNQGELDMEVAYEDGAWELVLLDEANEREVEPSESLLQGVPATRQTVPDNEAFGFLGAAGSAVWVLPQEETEGVLFLGIAGDEIPAGVFANDAVSLNLIGSRGPGAVSLYAVDEFGVPNVFFNSGDGIDTSDVFPVSVGGHSHQNWGFTAPGVYKLALQASGELQEGAVASASEVVEFTVEILDDGTGTVMPPMVFSDGEIDLEVAYEDGEFELVLLDEVNEREIEATDGILAGVAATLEPVPNDPAFGFLGNPGDRIFILPQDEREGILFLGIAGDEIPAGEFENDSVGLSLVGVDGPGSVFLYATDEFGSPTTFFNSADGLGADDVFPVSVGGHSHQNWGFSAAGQYEVTLQASGVKAGSGEAVASEAVAFFFEVIEPEIFNQGELDMEVVYEDGEWELALLDEANEREVEPDEALLQGLPSTRATVPDDPAFGFLGSAGDAVWVLPQDEVEGVLFLGIAGDEIPSGVFENDSVDLQLTGVRGPGEISLYSVDEFGAPNVFFNSADGIDGGDVFPVSVGGHSHQNWGFTAPGVYKVSLQASGTLAEGGVQAQSGVVDFTFEIESARGALTIAFGADGSPVLSWPTVAGTRYQLESIPAFDGREWEASGDVIVGDGQPVEVTVAVGEPGEARFYRYREVAAE